MENNINLAAIMAALQAAGVAAPANAPAAPANAPAAPAAPAAPDAPDAPDASIVEFELCDSKGSLEVGSIRDAEITAEVLESAKTSGTAIADHVVFALLTGGKLAYESGADFVDACGLKSAERNLVESGRKMFQLASKIRAETSEPLLAAWNAHVEAKAADIRAKKAADPKFKASRINAPTINGLKNLVIVPDPKPEKDQLLEDAAHMMKVVEGMTSTKLTQDILAKIVALQETVNKLK